MWNSTETYVCEAVPTERNTLLAERNLSYPTIYVYNPLYAKEVTKKGAKLSCFA